MLQVQVATKLGHAWCLSSSFWLSHNYLSTNTHANAASWNINAINSVKKKAWCGTKTFKSKEHMFDYGSSNSIQDTSVVSSKMYSVLASPAHTFGSLPRWFSPPEEMRFFGAISPELICLWSKTRNLHRKMTGFFKICAGKSFLKFNRLRKNRNLFGRNMMHITLISRWSLGFFGCDLGKLRIDTSHQHSMIWHQVLEWVLMFADRNFGTLRCTDALQNQTQIELKWQNISESEVMLQRVFLAKQHDQPKQGP